MNFKTIFLSLSLFSLIASIYAGKIRKITETNNTEEPVPQFLETESAITAKELIRAHISCFGAECNDKNTLLKNATVYSIHNLICWTFEDEGLAEQERKKIIELLQNIQQERPDLIQEALDKSICGCSRIDGCSRICRCYPGSLDFEYITALINLGANPHKTFKDKNYSAIEKLEARFGSIKIKNVESLDCDHWSFGQDKSENYECKEIEKLINFIKK